MQTIIAPDVPSLTAMFTILYFLAATQDIAVDGWAITMLRPENVNYAAVCNALGVSLGYNIGKTLFITLEAGDIMSLSQFLLVCGIVFMVMTTIIAFFKREKSLSEVQEEGGRQEPELGVLESYKIAVKIILSPRMYIWIIVLLTSNTAFSATESIFELRLTEFGVPRERVSQLGLPLIPLKLLTIILLSKHIVGSKPLDIWLFSYPVRSILCLGLTLMVSCSTCHNLYSCLLRFT